MDHWDELLARLPSEDCPPGLVSRVQVRLTRARRLQHLREQAGWVVLSGMTAFSLWLLAPHAGVVARALPAITLSDLAQWLGFALTSPYEAALTAFSGAASSTEALGGGAGPDLILALTLLAIPAAAVVLSLVGRSSRRGEFSP